MMFFENLGKSLPAGQRQWRLIASDSNSQVLLDRTDAAGTFSVSGKESHADEFIADLEDSTIFFTQTATGFNLAIENPTSADKSISLRPGESKKICGIQWQLLFHGQKSPRFIDNTLAPVTKIVDEKNHLELLMRLCQWVGTPMNDKISLTAAFEGLLELLTAYTPATNGILVLFDREGMQLSATKNLSLASAEKLLKDIPDTITQDILRSGSRMILPEQVGGRFGGQSTIFVRSIKSVAGFPVMAEKRVQAILLLGFDNLVSQLSEDLQQLLERVTNLIGMVIQRAQLREQLHLLNANIDDRSSENMGATRAMVGRSESLDKVYHDLRKLAPARVAVLLLGETGTGKELAAQEIHRLSNRKSGPFIAINAAALPESLIESELFGHKKGAFTGALSDRKGLIEQAEGGTLFIDEIGELPLALQAKLLRVLQEKAVQRIGDDRHYPIDFRLVTATHCKLKEMVINKSFRDDLYYRIAGATIIIPPLRERREDIVLLANFFKKQTASLHHIPEKDLSRAALDSMLHHNWPGNIRELQNSVERALIMSEGPVIRSEDLGLMERPTLRAGAAATATGNSGDVQPLAEAKDQWLRAYILHALEQNNWNKRLTSETLGIGLRTLFRHIDQLQIQGEGVNDQWSD
jgi:transcriptional regulator with GAF, ATPase, and Fis domain